MVIFDGVWDFDLSRLMMFCQKFGLLLKCDETSNQKKNLRAKLQKEIPNDMKFSRNKSHLVWHDQRTFAHALRFHRALTLTL